MSDAPLWKKSPIRKLSSPTDQDQEVQDHQDREGEPACMQNARHYEEKEG
jgi:hypothetical protein